MTAKEIAENDSSIIEDDEASELIKPKTQPHLMPQDATTVDPSKLTALTPEVVRKRFVFAGRWLSNLVCVEMSCTHIVHIQTKTDFATSND
jgi:hypothetical protein